MKKRIVILVVAITFQYFGFGQVATKLSIGEKRSKTIWLKEKHNYSIELKKGEFASLMVLQKGIDLKIATYDPAGNKIEEFDSNNGKKGNELVLVDGDITGVYRLEVMPLGETKRIKKGTYEIEFFSKEDSIEPHLNDVLNILNDRGALPGFAVNVVDSDTILYQKAFGFAKIASKTSYTPETVQSIASISKTFIAISLMMMVEEGKLTLDTAINDILPFEVTNPYFPKNPITVRHLATHTSTINDFPYYYTKAGVLLEDPPIELAKYPKEIRKTLKMAMENEDMSMVQFIKRMLTSEGEWYKKKNFLKRPPGQEWFYSNVGAVLAAHIVELVSSIPYDDFVRTRILKPLKLNSAGWSVTDIDSSKLAANYTQGSLLLPTYKIITYPDGQIYINSEELGKYLISWIRALSGHDGLLSASSYQEIMKVQHEEKQGKFKGTKNGLFWWQSRDGHIGHNGGDTGVIAIMKFNPETKLGITFMSNMDPTETDDALIPFEKVLFVLKRYAVMLN